VKLKNYSIEKLKDIIKESTSIRQVLIKLNIKACGGNYATIKNKVKQYSIDISHFLGKPQKGITKIRPPIHSLSEILCENNTYQSNKLKERLIKAGILKNKCYICGLTEWRGESLTMQLHHINGISTDHRLENLRLDCPNCHSQTTNYRGKNKKKSE